MENPFRDVDWTSIKDWFAEQGVWLLVTLVVAVLAYIILRVLAPRGVRSVLSKLDLTRSKKDQEQLAHNISRVIIWLGTSMIAAAFIFAAIPRFGVDISPAWEAIGGWMGSHGVRIAIVVAIAVIAHQIAKRLIYRIVENRVVGRRRRADAESRQRADTLSHFLTQFFMAVIWAIAVFMLLSEFGLDIGPLMAGAGVIGIAIGFGAQSLIKDIVSGLFIILENQYRKGDVVSIAGVIGIVEEVNIRKTTLRDLDGIVHIVPNGEIKLASNYTKGFSRVNLNISVAYGEDLDRCIAVINRVGEEMAVEEYWAEAVLQPPKVLRVDNLGDSGIDIKILGDTKPLRQWEVMGELRKRIKKTFDEEGIEIPWPHTKVYFGDEPKQLPGGMKSGVGKRLEQAAEELVPPGKAPRKRKKKVLPPEKDEDEGGEGDGD